MRVASRAEHDLSDALGASTTGGRGSVGRPYGCPGFPADLSTTSATSNELATESGGTASAVTSEITTVSPRRSYQRCLTQPTGSRPMTVRSKVVPSTATTVTITRLQR